MAATTSAVVVVKQRLVTLLSSLQVTYAPHPTYSGEWAAYLGRVKSIGHEVPTMKAGRKRREEEFTVMLHLEKLTAAQSPEVNEQEVLACFATVENSIANDPSLGLGVTVSPTLRAFVGDWTLDSITAPEGGWLTQLICGIDVKTRLA